MAYYFSINFRNKRKLRGKFRVLPQFFNEFSFSRLPEGKVIYFGYCQIAAGVSGRIRNIKSGYSTIIYPISAEFEVPKRDTYVANLYLLTDYLCGHLRFNMRLNFEHCRIHFQLFIIFCQDLKFYCLAGH
jgi:hypothetical protein